MDKLTEIIEKLASKAQNEVLPQFSVYNDVMAQIRLMQPAGRRLLPIEIFAGLTAVAASIVFILSLNALSSILNPMYQLFSNNPGASLW